MLFSELNCINHSGFKIYDDTLSITPFKNDHGHVKNSYGFKIKFGNKKIVYSGDTTYSKNVVENSKNADILIHEIMSVSKKIYDKNKRLRSVASTHTKVSILRHVVSFAEELLLFSDQTQFMMTGGTTVKTTQTPTIIGIVLMIMGSQKSTLNQQITIVTHKITITTIKAVMK